MGSIITSEPFKPVPTDYLHLEPSKGGCDYILVLIDHLTQFAQVYRKINKDCSWKDISEFYTSFQVPREASSRLRMWVWEQPFPKNTTIGRNRSFSNYTLSSKVQPSGAIKLLTSSNAAYSTRRGKKKVSGKSFCLNSYVLTTARGMKQQDTHRSSSCMVRLPGYRLSCSLALATGKRLKHATIWRLHSGGWMGWEQLTKLLLKTVRSSQLKATNSTIGEWEVLLSSQVTGEVLVKNLSEREGPGKVACLLGESSALRGGKSGWWTSLKNPARDR